MEKNVFPALAFYNASIAIVARAVKPSAAAVAVWALNRALEAPAVAPGYTLCSVAL